MDNTLLHVSSSPHVRSKVTTQNIMFTVVLALMPATLFGIYNFGLRALVTSFHDGPLPERDSCFSCDAEHIVVTAVKRAEDDNEKVIRFYEADGENETVNMHVFNKQIKASISHNEIKTIRTDEAEVNLIEWK